MLHIMISLVLLVILAALLLTSVGVREEPAPQSLPELPQEAEAIQQEAA